MLQDVRDPCVPRSSVLSETGRDPLPRTAAAMVAAGRVAAQRHRHDPFPDCANPVRRLTPHELNDRSWAAPVRSEHAAIN